MAAVAHQGRIQLLHMHAFDGDLNLLSSLVVFSLAFSLKYYTVVRACCIMYRHTYVRTYVATYVHTVCMSLGHWH